MYQIFSDTPAVYGGETSAYFFVGTKSHLVSVHKTKVADEDAALESSQDRVHKYDRPKRLLVKNAGVYCGNRFTQYPRDLWISLWRSESKKQNQNPAERKYQTVKRLMYWRHAEILVPMYGPCLPLSQLCYRSDTCRLKIASYDGCWFIIRYQPATIVSIQ